MFAIFVLIVSVIIAVNRYFDNKFVSFFLSNRKYVEIGVVICCGILMFFIVKYYPEYTRYMLTHSKKYEHLLPDTARNIFDFTSRHFGEDEDARHGQGVLDHNVWREKSTASTKRAVSANLKKQVAADQQWKCAICKNTLPANYEIDHITRLEYGGSNDYSNLQALCRNCHGTKTLQEDITSRHF